MSHRKDDLGQNDSAVADSMPSFSGVSSGGHPAKKTRHDLAAAQEESCSAELAAQLSSRLAQLMDAAAASRSNSKIQQCPNDRRESIPRRCVKDSSGAARPQSMDASLLSFKSAGGKNGDAESQSSSKSATLGPAASQSAAAASRASTQSPVVGVLK